ncbi:hypothetical protein ATANTOWER_010948, partial [Ataeniobius toweri]|nr:hypothetical protein [Ataeniobius toweri]
CSLNLIGPHWADVSEGSLKGHLEDNLVAGLNSCVEIPPSAELRNRTRRTTDPETQSSSLREAEC